MEIHSGMDMRPKIRGAVGAVLVLSAVIAQPSTTGAQEALRQAPSYDALISRLDQLPGVLEANALYDAALGRTTQAAARPNPVVALDGENAFGTGVFSGYRRAETTFALSQRLEVWGERGARIDVARAGVDVMELRRAQVRVLLAARLALAYGEAEAASRRFDLAREALALTEADAAAATLLVDQGREPAVRQIQAESEVHSARAVAIEAQAARTAALAWLSAVAGLDAIPETVAPGLLDRTPPQIATPPSAEGLGVRIAEAEHLAAERAVTVEEMRAKPGISAALGVRRVHETRDTALTFGVSVSVPLFDRNRGSLAEALAQQQAAAARISIARDETLAERRAAAANVGASAGRLSAADGAVRAAEHAYRLARIGVDAGRISQIELRSARSVFIAAQNAAVEARLARVRAEVEMARIDGRPPYRENR